MTNDDDDREHCSEGCDGYKDDDGNSCGACQAAEAEWRAEWETYGRREVANRYTQADVDDCYSDPCESAKRAGMMREVGE